MVGLVAAGVRNVGALLGFGLASFVGVANLAEIVRVVRANRRATGKGSLPALRDAVGRNRRLFGGLVAHIGIAVAVVAITASSSFARQAEVTLRPGGALPFAGDVLRFEGARTIRQPQRDVLIADLTVLRDGRPAGRLTPSLNLYPGASEPIGTPSIRYGILRDLYSSLVGVRPEAAGGGATFRFYSNPGVMWLWVGGAIVALGGLVAGWRERRRPLAPPPEPVRELAAARTVP